MRPVWQGHLEVPARSRGCSRNPSGSGRRTGNGGDFAGGRHRPTPGRDRICRKLHGIPRGACRWLSPFASSSDPRRSHARSAVIARRSRCRLMPASSSTTVRTAAQGSSPSPAIAACIALTPTCRVRRFKRVRPARSNGCRWMNRSASPLRARRHDQLVGDIPGDCQAFKPESTI